MDNGHLMSGWKDSEEDFDTRDLYFVAALMTMGVDPVGTSPVMVIAREHRSGDNYQFNFKPMTRDGKYRTRELLKLWVEGEEFVKREPDHPFATAVAFALNMKSVMKYVKGSAPYAFVRRGNAVAMVAMDVTPEVEEEILGRLPKKNF